MSDHSLSQSASLIPPGDRTSGLLLHVTSLPSPFGVGDLGPEAFHWVDMLADSGQTWWQILPVGPPGLGHSPYDPLSTFAGNLMLVSPQRMLDDRLVADFDFGHHGFDDSQVEFDTVRHYKQTLLQCGFENFQNGATSTIRESYQAFLQEQGYWVHDFALFMAIKRSQNGAFFYNWPHELASRNEAALAQVKQELHEDIEFHTFCQFIFFKQWHELKSHAASRNVKLLGDLPFFVSHDSAEVWANSHLFQLDETFHPKVVAGVPPDYFSATGQLWGNPIYNWDEMRSRRYEWWTRRLSALLKLVDGVRLDHFRAFAAAWNIPAGAPTAEQGEWIPGPGDDFFNVMRERLGGLPFIAEDLGLITEDVHKLRLDFGMPGMRVLQFAFDGDPQNIFLPEYYDENSAAFTGTHDNDTTRGWFNNLDANGMQSVQQMFGPSITEDQIAHAMIETVWQSKAGLAIAPLQDVLNLGSDARMNIPGLAAGNWGWRVRREQLSADIFANLAKLTSAANRD